MKTLLCDFAVVVFLVVLLACGTICRYQDWYEHGRRLAEEETARERMAKKLELAPHPRHGTRFSVTGCDDNFERWNEAAKEYR